MKDCIALMVVVAFMMASPMLAAEGDELQGVWVVKSLKLGDRDIDELNGTVVEFAGDQFKMKVDEKTIVSSYEAKTKTAPKQIDFLGERTG